MGAGVTVYAGYLLDKLRKADELIRELRSRLEELENYRDKRKGVEQ